MPVLIVGNEKNFAALRPRLFEGRISSKAAGQVADAIRAANPHADLDRLAPGTVLTIPDAPKIRVRGELSVEESAAEAVRGLAEAGRAALEELAETAVARERETAEERKRLAAALKSKELPAAMREEPALKADVDAARAAVEEEDAASEQRLAMVKDSLAEWTGELEALRAQFE